MSPRPPARFGPAAALLAALVCWGVACEALAAKPFETWAAIVVAGDWRANTKQNTEAFDNARRDVAKALVDHGFERADVLEFSLRPPKPTEQAGALPTAKEAIGAFMTKAREKTGGCLFYVSSHGDEKGVVFGPNLVMTPAMLARVLDEGCPGRPAVAVVSACFSGVFVKPLAAANRLVLTAARPDRSSFGCGVNDRHPWFDDCVLESFGQAKDFPDLGRRAQACVATREKKQKASPPSEPQLSVGADFPLLAPGFAPATP